MHYRELLRQTRTTYNPPVFRVNPAALSPWSITESRDEDAVGYLLQTGFPYAGPARVAEQVAKLRELGVNNIMCQMNWDGITHEHVTASMQRFGEPAMMKFRR